MKIGSCKKRGDKMRSYDVRNDKMERDEMNLMRRKQVRRNVETPEEGRDEKR